MRDTAEGPYAAPGRQAGYWHRALGAPPKRPSLTGFADVDVCIVGGGYSGLWTAWALSYGDPSLRIAVLEAEHIGFGASGRNGGWLSGLLPGDRRVLARGPGGRAGVIALQRQLVDAVAGVVAACEQEGIDADINVGGTVAVATNRAQMSRLRSAVQEDRRWDLGPEDIRELGAAETAQRIRVDGAVGSTFSPHCARIQPAKLVRGLAAAVESRGVAIYERTPALAIEPGRVQTPHVTVRAPWVVRATEGYTAALPGLRRRLLPMNSSMIVTEPLPLSTWSQIGWDGVETLRDGAHAYVYLQRTADDRIAIGGRGVPYRFGSRLDHAGDTPAATVTALEAALHRLLPATRGAAIADSWSGVLGVARDWCPSVGIQQSGDGGLAWAGGYVGDGVTTSHLAGLTLADLILKRDTPRTELPWVGHISRAWEPEPLRWLGVHSIYGLYRAADKAEARRPDVSRSSRWATLAGRISGRP
jgi:glycine/D-amino acid oxidase-like deaminating enzyme